ncbi:FmdE family protein [uncultured Methanobacterium sp.]|uniref:FmdE family protein n=1 Tax=uncultured Methanobacterium sp. TaxID=176306 RepID=UPI002AA66574|nr:FmdE family protein [uncultured Methanobacterium sp.]
MRKQGVILVIATIMALILCGAVSATDSSTTGGEGNLSDVNASEPVDPILWVDVGYEYADDKINPEIAVTDSNNNVTFDKTKYSDTLYKLNFTCANVTNGTLFNVIVRAPGYIAQTQQVAVSQAGTDPEFIGTADFDMQATDSYKIGRNVTAAADNLLHFATADDVLCITTAGLAYHNGTTTEDCLEGILNGSYGEISYGQGNLLTFQSIRTDPLDFCFVVRNGNELTAAFFKNGTLTPAYFGTFSAIDQALWDNTIVPVFGDKAFGYVSLANAWKEGLSTDILRQAAYHGHVCLGTISGQAMVSLLLKYYPPGVYGNAGELEATSYRAVSVPGNSDDDAIIYSLDLTPGKRSWVGYETSGSGAADNMIGFIRWCDSTNTGTLIIMRFNEEAVLQLYKQQTGNNAYTGIAGELAFNAWLVNKLENDPDSLVEIMYVFENITPQIHNNLTGGVDSKNVVCDALGLDMDYILGLNLTNVANQRVATNYTTGNLTQDQIKKIGEDAANMAIALFAADGINLEKDDYNLTVFTSAGYVRVNGQVMDMTFDGIYDVLGSRLSRATLLPVHNARFNDLYFQFSLEYNGTVITKTIWYNSTTGILEAKDKAGCIIDQVIPYDPPYDVLMAWLWHNHVCGGSTTGYLITDYVYDNFPITADEQYSYVSTNDICRDDILSYLLGISAGDGTYYNQRMKSAGSEVGIISIYDSRTNTRRVAIINLVAPKFSDGNNYDNYIRVYKILQKYDDWNSPDCQRELENIPNLISGPSITLTANTYVTEEEWQMIISGGGEYGDSLSYIHSAVPQRTQAELISLMRGPQTPGGSITTGTNSGSLVGSTTGIGNSLLGSSNGSNTSGVNVSAATVTNSTSGSVGTQPGEAKAYEVTQAGAQGSDGTPWGLYAVVGVIAVLALGGVGFFFKGGKF